MEDGVNQEKVADGCPQPETGYSQVSADGGIDLMVLFWVLLKRKWLIAAVAAVVTLGAVGYALLATPVYKIFSGVFPPVAADISALNTEVIRSVGGGVSPEMAFNSFLRNVESKKVRRELFNEMELRRRLVDEEDADVPDDWIFQEFDESLSVQHPTVDKKESYCSPRVVVSLEGENPVLSADVLNKLIERAGQASIQELVNNVCSAVDLQMEALTRDIQALRSTALKKRMDRIAGLEEAAAIARAVDLGDPVDFNVEKINTAAPENSQILIDVTARQSGLYSLGYEALEAEAKQLRERKSDDPFIAALRDKEAGLGKLEMIEIDPEKLCTARIDQPAYVSQERLKPKRARIVIAGGLLGFMLGCGLALFLNFFSSVSGKESR